MANRSIQAPVWVQIGYVLSSVMRALFQRRFASLLTIFVISLTLTLPSLSYLLWKNANQALSQFSPESEMTLYLHNTLNELDSQLVVDKVRQQEGIADLNYVSRQQSLENFRSWSGFNEELDVLENNPLPAVVIVQLKKDYQTPEKRESLQTALLKIKGVQKIEMDNDWLAKLAAIHSLSVKVSLAASVLMLLTLLLVIGSSIRADVYNQQSKIEILQLLGATEQFILRPFIYTGILYMWFSGLLAMLFSYLLIGYFSAAIQQMSDIFTLSFQAEGMGLGEVIFFMVFCTALGYLIARVTSIRHIRYLERKLKQ